jgi:hypothetical protein
MPDPKVQSAAAISHTPPTDSYLVIVAGLMNPSIHHLQWYRMIGAIDESELQAALRTPFNTTTPVVSQLQFGSPTLTINCQAGQWWIQSTDASMWTRMVDIASLVFSKLNETPVSGYGLMAQHHIPTAVADVKSVIAKCLSEIDLGIPTGKIVSSNIAATATEEDYKVSVSIQPSVLNERAVFGLYHRQYDAPKLQGEYFDLGALLNGRVAPFLSGADKFFSDLVAAVNARAQKGYIHG